MLYIYNLLKTERALVGCKEVFCLLKPFMYDIEK